MYNNYDFSEYSTIMDTYSTSGTGALYALGGFFVAFMGFFLFVALVVGILQIISMWRIFIKAGEKGWKSIIPIYNLVILFKISGLTPWLIFVYLAGAIPFIGWIAVLILTIYLTNNLSKSFGKDTSFTVGLVLLPSIFFLILGLGSSKYVGPGGNPVEVSDE